LDSRADGQPATIAIAISGTRSKGQSFVHTLAGGREWRRPVIDILREVPNLEQQGPLDGFSLKLNTVTRSAVYVEVIRNGEPEYRLYGIARLRPETLSVLEFFPLPADLQNRFVEMAAIPSQSGSKSTQNLVLENTSESWQLSQLIKNELKPLAEFHSSRTTAHKDDRPDETESVDDEVAEVADDLDRKITQMYGISNGQVIFAVDGNTYIANALGKDRRIVSLFEDEIAISSRNRAVIWAEDRAFLVDLR
jgi:hypothetical protein